MSLHMITHAVMFAVIATLVKKYFQLMYHVEDLQERCLYNEFKRSVDEDSEVKMEDTPVQVENDFQAFVTCQSSRIPSHHVCHVRNICYEPNHNTFVYFYRDNNVPFIDKQSLPYLSTPVGFNDHRMSVTYVKEKFANDLKLKWINKTTYIFNRFKSDNLMHVLHDDLMPLFFTLKHFEGLKSNMAATKFDVQLLFLDDWPQGDFMELYNMFTNSAPIYRVDLLRERELLCFSSAIVGLLLDTLWYKYGFTEPQGPIVDSSVNAQHIRSASQFILQNLNLKQEVKESSDYIVLISRKENRKILNENDLVRKISQEFAMKVIILGSETHALNEMISLVANSIGIMGVHGSLLSLAVFLKPGSMLIELFPYAVPAIQYTPYKTLVDLDGMGIAYKSWENTYPDTTIGHPDYIPEHGGITHLSLEEQQMIINQKTVPRHLCCNDPSWLYHIYQDTLVNITEIIPLMKMALNQRHNIRILNITETPSRVKNILCRLENNESKCNIQLQWDKPWNIHFLNLTNLHYEVLLENTGSNDTVLYVVDQDSLTVDIDCEKNYIVWVRAVINDYMYGDYVSEECLV